jgi:hypothetical protein
MGLFFELLNSINDPKQSGNIDQLSGLLHAATTVSQQHNLDSGMMQTVLSAMSGPMQSALQNSGGDNPMDLLSGLMSGNAGAIGQIFTPQLQQQMVQAVSQKTGINSSILQAAIPVLIPVVLNLFKMGGSSSSGKLDTNSLLNTFLKGDRADLGQVMKYADRFLNPA